MECDDLGNMVVRGLIPVSAGTYFPTTLHVFGCLGNVSEKAFPKTWDPMEMGVKVVALKQTDAAYEGVEEHITKSCGNLDVSIVKVTFYVFLSIHIMG